MEWNAKWDWENLDIFSSKAIISPKKLQSTTDWGMDEGDGDVDGSFNLSGVVGGSGGSGSDLGNNSSAKSSVSASTESSLKEGMRVSNFAFEGFGGFPGASYGNKKDLVGSDMNGTSPPFEASVCSGEPFIGLKLGKRTYFENNLAKSSNTKTSSFSEIPVSSVSTTAAKKVKSSCPNVTNPRCQVEGCNLDLSSAKEYHRKHRVCENHSKCPKVIVAGQERRFCQQCSRFHGLSEFDEKKRSCRRRLSDHNARRRKPQQETIQFNSTSLSSSFYDGRQQLSFVLNNVPVVQTRPAANSAWESTCSSKYTLGKVKAEKGGGDLDGMPHYAGLPVPSGISSPTHAFNKLLPSKGTRAEVFDQGFKESLSSEVDALDIRRALSLLSNNSWGSCEPDFVTLDHPVQANNNNNLSQNTMQPIPQGVPLPSPDYWQLDQQAIDPRFHALAAKASTGNNHFQEYQLFKAPYDARFYSDPLD